MALNSYYRLKQTDYDGSFSYSSVINSDCSNRNGSITIFPNPVSSGTSLNVHMNNYEPNTAIVMVLENVLGEIIFSKVIMTDDNGNVSETLHNSGGLAAGMYHVIGTSGNNRLINQKVVVQ